MAKISAKLVNYLEKNKYKHDVIEHRTTYTAWDTAQTEKVKPQEVGKTLVLKADNSVVLAVLPSNRNLDKQKFLKTLNAWRKKAGKKAGEKSAKKVEWAKEAWMKKNIPGKVGAVPPFSGLLKLPLFIDALLVKNKKIYLGSGEYTVSLRVNTNQYMKVENPVKGSFSMKKN